MNDDDMLAAMRSSLAGAKDALTDVHLNRPPEAIMARARGRRLRRGLPGVGAGGLALGIGLALALPGGSPVASGGSQVAPGGSPASRAVHVNLAAWSVNTSSNGLVSVTIRELKDRAGLQRTLAAAGIPAILTSGRVCNSSVDPALLSKVLAKVAVRGETQITINPAAMPPGTELVIGIGILRHGSQRVHAAALGLTKKGAPMDCSGTKAPGSDTNKPVTGAVSR